MKLPIARLGFYIRMSNHNIPVIPQAISTLVLNLNVSTKTLVGKTAKPQPIIRTVELQVIPLYQSLFAVQLNLVEEVLSK